MPGGVGVSTGVMGVSPATSAILLDHQQVYLRTVRGASAIHGGEYSGLPGFRFTVVRVGEANILLGLIPPYPQAVAEAVIELYLMGIKNFIAITRGARLGKRGEGEDRVVAAKAAIAQDGVSSRIAPEGTPLLASAELLRAIVAYAELGGLRGRMVTGITVTLPSIRSQWSYEAAEEYVGMRDVWTVDSVTAPLYALQYPYVKMNALSIVVAERSLSPHPRPIETDMRSVERHAEREIDLISTVLIASIEAIKTVMGE